MGGVPLDNATYIILKDIETGGLKPFRFDVAAKLLKFERQQLKVKCWDLPEDSNFIYKNGQLIRKPSS